MAEKKKSKAWVLKRHKTVRTLLAPFIRLMMNSEYDIEFADLKDTLNRPYLIIMNHQTGNDQFFVGGSVEGPVYYIATEDIFSLGFPSKLISYLVNPIPIKKSNVDMRTVKTCIKVAKEGGTIALFPEGNRTYSGETGYMKPSIVKLAKAIKLPVCILHVTGGFGADPRWAKARRKGPVKISIARILEYDEFAKMPDDKLFEIFTKELYNDEAAVCAENGITYDGDDLAEYIERVLYVCPDCGLSEFRSEGDRFTCRKCGRTWKYNPDLTITYEGAHGACDSDLSEKVQIQTAASDFRTFKDFYHHQESVINSMDVLNSDPEKVFYQDTVALSRVLLYDKKVPVSEKAELTLFHDHYRLRWGEEELILNFTDLDAVSCMGRNKLQIYAGEQIHQFKGDERFNPVKYMNIYYRYMNQQKMKEAELSNSASAEIVGQTNSTESAVKEGNAVKTAKYKGDINYEFLGL